MVEDGILASVKAGEGKRRGGSASAVKSSLRALERLRALPGALCACVSPSVKWGSDTLLWGLL